CKPFGAVIVTSCWYIGFFPFITQLFTLSQDLVIVDEIVLLCLEISDNISHVTLSDKNSPQKLKAVLFLSLAYF
ncbi:hypothetical protein, partial [Enterobacter hormaechei]|uniref:hypothetical protein n=1 Tax=Enterobacter hormaechei TaxID=158836 RepID=UPI001953BD93